MRKWIVFGAVGTVILIIIGGIIALFITGLAHKSEDAKVKARLLPVQLTWWGVYDNEDAFAGIAQAYRKIHPNVALTYRKFRPEEYERMILEGLAEDQGPDIFTIDERWLPRYRTKMLSSPASVTLPFQFLAGPSFRKEVRYILKEVPLVSARQVKDEFVDAVFPRAVEGNTVIGLPLSVDTLAILYNRDLLNQAHLTRSPSSWEEFKDAVKATTRADEKGNLVQAGVALGTANVPHAADILSLLMMQNGTTMMSPDGSRVAFADPSQEDPNYRPGAEALRFYTDFANQTKEVYTWNDSFGDAFDAFATGRAAFLFVYGSEVSRIKAKNPQFDFGITTVPQLSQRETNYANLWLNVVSKKTKYPDEAWDVLQFAASAEHVTSYIEKVARAPALRAVIEQVKDDPALGAFARAALTARTWYRGRDPAAMEAAFAEMIASVLDGRATPEEAVAKAVRAVEVTL